MADSDRFDCRHCDRSFGTAAGRGLHMWRVHPQENSAAVRRVQFRRKWDPEELWCLAAEEIRLREAGCRRELNARLSELIDGRSIVSVRGARAMREYKDLLERMRVDGRPLASGSAVAVRGVPRFPGEPLRLAVEGLVCELQSEHTTLCTDRLLGIAGRALSGLSVGGELAGWVNTHLAGSPRTTGRAGAAPRVPGAPLGKRVRGDGARRQRFRRIQWLWEVDRRRAAREVLEGGPSIPSHSLRELEEYWRPIVEAPSAPWGGDEVHGERLPEGVDIWTPVTMAEANALCPAVGSASGLDRVSPAVWRGLNWKVRAVILDLLLLERRVPGEWLRAGVTMIPKCDEVRSPGDYRPISVASVIVRHFHRILATRLESVVPLVPQQFGFRRGFDGVAGNIFLLDSVLRTAWRRKRSLCAAFLDVRKAFDSVSHAALFHVLKARGVQEEFCQYIQSVYGEASSQLCVGGMESAEMRPTRGVRQGDPLSPILFNLAMDHVVAGLPREIGFLLGGVRCGVLAYADDLVLLASSVPGLKRLLKVTEEGLRDCGLEVNPSKCRTLTVALGVGKRTVWLDEEVRFFVGGEALAPVGREDRWEYLGVKFGHCGMVPDQVEVWQGLERISRAPLKPQQRMEVLRTFYLPSLFHRCTFGVTFRYCLKAMDIAVRSAVRRWLRLPHDAPCALMHAPVRFGGLGIPRFEALAPFLRNKRFAGVCDALEEFGLSDDVREVLGGDCPAGIVPPHPSVSEVRSLYSSVDGADLDGAIEVGASSAWMTRHACGITGRDYVQYLRLYAGALPTLARLNRGRRPVGGVACRRGCGVPETNAHVVNYCHEVRPGVILRHHAVVKLLGESLRRVGWKVFRERTLVGEEERCRPDLIATRDEELVVLDVTVVTGPIGNEVISQVKVAKYGREWVLREAAAVTGVRTARRRVVPVTITYKGVWSSKSAKQLKSMGIGTRPLVWMTIRVLRGGHMNYTSFMRRAYRQRTRPAPRRFPP